VHAKVRMFSANKLRHYLRKLSVIRLVLGLLGCLSLTGLLSLELTNPCSESTDPQEVELRQVQILSPNSPYHKQLPRAL
jgi:hypothetical protein